MLSSIMHRWSRPMGSARSRIPTTRENGCVQVTAIKRSFSPLLVVLLRVQLVTIARSFTMTSVRVADFLVMHHSRTSSGTRPCFGGHVRNSVLNCFE